MFYGTKVRYGTYIFVDFQYITVFKQAKKVRLKYLKTMPLQTVFRILSLPAALCYKVHITAKR